MDHAVVSRYSRSFVDVIAEKKDALQLLEQLESMINEITGNVQVVHYFQNPAALGKEKVETISAALKEMDLDQTVANLVITMIRNGRFSSLRYLPEHVRKELYRRLGMVQVDLQVAAPLSDDMKNRFSRAFEKKTGRKVVLNVTEDPNILGGAVARIGSTLIDGSLKTNLSRIREKLSGE